MDSKYSAKMVFASKQTRAKVSKCGIYLRFAKSSIQIRFFAQCLRQWHLIVKQLALGHRALRTQTSWIQESRTWASNTQTSPKQISSTGHFNHLFIDFNHHIIDFKHCFNDFIIRSLTSILDSFISNIYFRSLINWFQTLIHLFQSIINWFQSLIRWCQTPILWL